jgi:hypothetical protein
VFYLLLFFFLLCKTEELLTNLELRNHSTLITAHANYIKGGNVAKMNKLRDHNMWLATKNYQTGQWDGECLPFKMMSKQEASSNALDASLST